MKNIYLGKIIKTLFSLIILLSIVIKTNTKMIFIPFIICFIAYLLENIFLYLNKRKEANLFHKLFIYGFLLYIIGFLIYACYYVLSTRSYTLFIPIIIFSIVILLIINKITIKIDLSFLIYIIPIIIIAMSIITGIYILITGFKNNNFMIIYMGLFFIFVSLAFVLGGLYILGYLKERFLKFYFSLLITVIGFITIFIIPEINLWISVPIIMIIIGIISLIKIFKPEE